MAHNVTYIGEWTQPSSPIKVTVYVGVASLTLGNFTITKTNTDTATFGAVDAGTTIDTDLGDGYYRATIDENDLQVTGQNTFKFENTSTDIGTVVLLIKADPTDEAVKFPSAPNDA